MTIQDLKEIVCGDRFLSLSHSQQCLYFHAVVNADENGCVYGIKALARAIGCPLHDVQFLEDEGLIHGIDNLLLGHCQISYWKKYKERK